MILRPKPGEWPHPNQGPATTRDKELQNQKKKTRQKERRSRLKQLGLCTYCKNPVTDGKSRCVSCLAKLREYGKNGRAEKTESQRQKQNASDRERRHRRKELGLCTSCNEPIDSCYTRCNSCLDRLRKYSKDRRAEIGEVGRQEENTANGDRRRRNMTLGLCTKCSTPVTGNYKSCDGCRARDRKRAKERWGKRKETAKKGK